MPVVRSDWGVLSYRCSGAGPALLLLHGLGSSSRDWAPQIEAFAQRHTVIAPDFRGHGQSSRIAGGVTIRDFAADAAAVLSHAGFSSADVVGLSLGGAVAFQMALDQPQEVRSLTIVNSAPAFVAQRWRERVMLVQRRALVRLMSMQRMGQALAKRLFPDDAALQAQFIERFAENDKASYRATLDALIGWSVADRIGQIAVPTLVVGADQDYTPVAAKQAYVDQMPNARLAVIENAHHAVTAERPQAFNRVLAEFLDAARSDAGTGAPAGEAVS
ncbi:MAG: alpha/beta fold hydrolase [Nevskiales bacterium]|nr:alpha/beta fold hydrolase [Nevskiales bacterium]